LAEHSKDFINFLVVNGVRIGLESFAANLIAAGRRGDEFNDNTLSQLRAVGERDIQNTSIEGLSIQNDAKVLNEAVLYYGQAVDRIIRVVERNEQERRNR
jgi:hypothetical protein